MHYQETKYEISIILDALKAMMNTKQREGETLAEYTWQFKAAKDLLESQIRGALILTKYIKGMVDYIDKDTASFNQCGKEANARLFAFLYLENSDQLNYSSIIKTFQKTIAEANNVLSNHRFDAATNKKNAKGTHQESTKDKGDESPNLTFAQMEGKCYFCVKGCHKSPQCLRTDQRKNGA